MTDQLRQAAQQALEALENAVRYHGIMLMADPPQAAWKYHRVEDNAKQAITAIKKALAQPVQEPVVYDKTEINSFVIDLYDLKMREGKHGHYEALFHCVHQAIARVNAPAAQPEQKPVACRFCHDARGCWTWQCYKCGEIDDVQKPTPPAAQRVWVGLTEDDKFEMAAAQYGWEDLLIAAEAALRSKNT